jgi:hypothetical protein
MSRKAIVRAFVPMFFVMIVLVCLKVVSAGTVTRDDDRDDSINFQIFGNTPLTMVRGVNGAGAPGSRTTAGSSCVPMEQWTLRSAAWC